MSYFFAKIIRIIGYVIRNTSTQVYLENFVVITNAHPPIARKSQADETFHIAIDLDLFHQVIAISWYKI